MARRRVGFSWTGPEWLRGGMSREEVAAALGVTTRRVTQIELGALRKLQKSARAMAIVRQLLEGR